MGLSAALSTAARSLEVFSAGIQVAGQNIANANTPNYIREDLILGQDTPYRQGNMIYGTGVMANGIRQQIDKFLEGRFNAASSDASGSSTRNTIYKQLETAIQELSDSDLSTSLNSFLTSLEEVANQPEILATRQIAVRQGEQLAQSIVSLRDRIDKLRDTINNQVSSLVVEANQLIEKVASLNPQIISMESAGLLSSDATGLRTQRYVAIQRLAEILPVHTVELAGTGVDLYLGTDYLLMSDQVQKLELHYEVELGRQIYYVRNEDSNTPLTGIKGELAALISGRDDILGGFISQLDDYTRTIINEFNKIHTSGEGVNGITSVTSADSAKSVTSALNAAGLPFDVQHGSLTYKVVNQQTGIAETHTIQIDLDGIGTDTSLTDLTAAFGTADHVTAALTTDRRLKLTTDSGYEIRFGADTSGVLAALGINTFFTGSSSSNIGINSAVKNDALMLATGTGGGPGDGSNVLKLAQFSSGPSESLGGISLSQKYNLMIAELGQQSAAEASLTDGFAAYRESLRNQRAQYSGVSLDEETMKVLEMQKSYQVAARFISAIDEMFQTLLQV